MREVIPLWLDLLPSLALLLAPLQELAEQRLAIGSALRHARSGLVQEGLEVASDLFLVGGRSAETLEHVLGDLVTRPAGNGRPEIDVTPLRVPRRDLEAIPLGEHLLDEAFDASVAVAAFLPVENRDDRRHRERVVCLR